MRKSQGADLAALLADGLAQPAMRYRHSVLLEDDWPELLMGTDDQQEV